MKWTNRYNLPRTFYDAVTKDNYDHSKEENAISVTQLIDSPKIRLLKNIHFEELEEDVSDSIWRLLGSAVHSVMETIDPTNRLIEERLREEITVTLSNGEKATFIVTGKPDIYDGNDNKITDYKITSVWSVVFQDSKSGWVKQPNVYAYFIRGLGFLVDKLSIVAILRDHSENEYDKSAQKGGGFTNYPPKAVVEIPIAVWSDQETEQYIYDRLILHASVKKPEDYECSAEEKWTKPTTWAVYSLNKDGSRKARATKVFKNEEDEDEAKAMALNIGGEVQKRPGIDARCAKYCPVRMYCEAGKALMERPVETEEE
jgi:hypothetical protein